jgi:hypothetical protein
MGDWKRGGRWWVGELRMRFELRGLPVVERREDKGAEGRAAVRGQEKEVNRMQSSQQEEAPATGRQAENI